MWQRLRSLTPHQGREQALLHISEGTHDTDTAEHQGTLRTDAFFQQPRQNTAKKNYSSFDPPMIFGLSG